MRRLSSGPTVAAVQGLAPRWKDFVDRHNLAMSSQSAPAMAETEGDSSCGEEEVEATPNRRGFCGQFVWPCPREYPADAEERAKQKWLIPADMQKSEVGLLFKDTCFRIGLGPKLLKVHVFDEPHKRYNKQTKQRERHMHVVFKMSCGFGHVKLQKALAAQGVHGHFSFNLVGYVAYLGYCLQPSAKKLAADLDQEPWSWPAVPAAALLDLCKHPSPQMNGRNGKGNGPGNERKRKLMTFSEVTDAFVERSVKTEGDAWELAKSRKVAGGRNE